MYLIYYTYHYAQEEWWESRFKVRKDATERAEAFSPFQLTSLLIQHDQSPDSGIFTLTDRQTDGKRKRGKKKSQEKEERVFGKVQESRVRTALGQ